MSALYDSSVWGRTSLRSSLQLGHRSKSSRQCSYAVPEKRHSIVGMSNKKACLHSSAQTKGASLNCDLHKLPTGAVGGRRTQAGGACAWAGPLRQLPSQRCNFVMHLLPADTWSDASIGAPLIELPCSQRCRNVGVHPVLCLPPRSSPGRLDSGARASGPHVHVRLFAWC